MGAEGGSWAQRGSPVSNLSVLTPAERRPGCRCWVAKEGHFLALGRTGARRHSPWRRGGRSPTPLGGKRRRERARPPALCKQGLEGDARPAPEVETGCWFTRGSLGERNLRAEAAAESGSAPASRGAPDSDSKSAAGAPRASWLRPLELSLPPASFSTAPAKPEPDCPGPDSLYDLGSCD